MGDAGPYAGMVRREWFRENGPKVVGVAWRGLRAVLRRALLVFVILPSLVAGSVLAGSMAVGFTSTPAIVQGFYDYADTSIRAAPTGMVRMQTCDDPAPPPDVLAPPRSNKYGGMVGCRQTRTIDVPASQVMTDHVAQINFFYWVLVGVSVLCLFLTFVTGRYGDIVWVVSSPIGVRGWIIRVRWLLDERRRSARQ